MESVEKELLLHELNNYGYQLVQSVSSSPEETLIKMIESDDLRIIEGIPVVLTHLFTHNHYLDFSAFEKTLPSGLQRRFRLFAAITYIFLFWVPESENAREMLLNYLRNREPMLLKQVQEKLSTRQKFALGGGLGLDTERLENTYKNYVTSQFYATKENLAKKLDQQRQYGFLEAINELFTEKQKEILFKLMNNTPLEKTEREYYSRTIKPRLKALCNIDLHSFSSTLLSK